MNNIRFLHLEISLFKINHYIFFNYKMSKRANEDIRDLFYNCILM
jgi:hypothetical protein